MSNDPGATPPDRHPARKAAAVLATALLVGCAPEPPSAELFPLKAGHRWTYSQHIDHPDGRTEASWLVMSTLPPEDFEGRETFRRHSEDGVDYWLRRDETGIYRVASQHELDQEPTKDGVPRYVLKEPLQIGTEWQAATVPYLLERRQGFPTEVRHEGKRVLMRYVIDALEQSVAVPAGRFEGCLTVRGQAVVRLFADGGVGWRDMPLNTTEWYCPGPGLVKMERDEPANSTLLVGGKLTLELHEWQRP